MGQLQRSRRPARTWMQGLVTALAVCAWAAGCKDDGPSAPRDASLSGAVRTEQGAPVAGVPVHLAGDAGFAANATTDAEGRFTFGTVRTGTYRVSLTAPLGYEAPAEREVRLESDASVDLALTAVRDARATVSPGTTDTVAVASGTYVAVAVPVGAEPVSLRVAEAAGTGFGDLDVVGTPVVLTAATASSPAPSAGPRFAVAGDGASVAVTVWQRVPSCSGGSVELAFRVDPEASGGDPMFLYATSSCTTWTDPHTGASGSAVSGSMQVPAGSRLPLAAFIRDVACTTGTARRLTLAPGSAEGGGRIPLILIHGWQKDQLSCASVERFHPETETFGDFLAEFNKDTSLSSRYSVYILRYPTFQPVAVASEFLREQIDGHGWASNGVVLVGHSMGGLVGRGYLAAYGGDAVRALITLGTPHEGSPLADIVSMPSHCGSGLSRLGKIFTPTDGSADLSPGGPFITSLRGHTEHGTRVLTIGGDVQAASLGDLGPGLWLSRCAVEGLLEDLGATDRRTDAVVPVASALPAWTGVQHLITGEDHLELPGGPAATRTRFMLNQVAQCLPGTAPAAAASNGFPLSGTLARQPDGRIDVVLNPITVNGEAVRGLTKSNFAIVENNCLKYFDITTDEGNLGVDIVFVQDLSGSMGGAISGVRSSVLTWAESLRTRGLNVRLGSVGFSGQGTIISHPGAGACEALGPVQDLASPQTFRDHVSATWRASGGCDGPENALEAVEYAHRNMSWRSGAARVYILITDVSMHVAGQNCNGAETCTDQTVASIVSLVGGTGVIHAVAPASAATRTSGGGGDPWLLAEGTGGSKLVLPSGGNVDLNALGITDRIADVVRLTFTSTTDLRAMHRLRVRVTVDGKVAEIAPGLVSYDVDPALQRAAP